MSGYLASPVTDAMVRVEVGNEGLISEREEDGKRGSVKPCYLERRNCTSGCCLEGRKAHQTLTP
jgi:hypothetical protein